MVLHAEVENRGMQNCKRDFLLGFEEIIHFFNSFLMLNLPYSLLGAELLPLGTRIKGCAASPSHSSPFFLCVYYIRNKSHLEGGCFNSLSAFTIRNICVLFLRKTPIAVSRMLL